MKNIKILPRIMLLIFYWESFLISDKPYQVNTEQMCRTDYFILSYYKFVDHEKFQQQLYSDIYITELFHIIM